MCLYVYMLMYCKHTCMYIYICECVSMCYICMCMYKHMFVCIYTYMLCMCVEVRSNLGYCFSGTVHLFETESLIVLNLSTRLKWLACSRGLFVCVSPAVVFLLHATMPSSLKWVLGTELNSSCLQDKYSTHWAVSQMYWFFTFSVKLVLCYPIGIL